jgi:hypothetical protein
MVEHCGADILKLEITIPRDSSLRDLKGIISNRVLYIQVTCLDGLISEP